MTTAQPGYSPDLEEEHYRLLDQRAVDIRLVSGRDISGILQLRGPNCLQLLDPRTNAITLVYVAAIATIALAQEMRPITTRGRPA